MNTLVSLFYTYKYHDPKIKIYLTKRVDRKNFEIFVTEVFSVYLVFSLMCMNPFIEL